MNTRFNEVALITWDVYCFFQSLFAHRIMEFLFQSGKAALFVVILHSLTHSIPDFKNHFQLFLKALGLKLLYKDYGKHIIQENMNGQSKNTFTPTQILAKINKNQNL